MPDEVVTVALRQEDGFRFSVDFGGVPAGAWTVDENPPLGGGAGPSPSQTLAAAIGHCLSSTLLDCLRRARVPTRHVATEVHATRGRNAAGRLRILRMSATVRAEPVDPADRPRMDRCVAVFEEYCTVSASVRQGIPMDVTVERGAIGG